MHMFAEKLERFIEKQSDSPAISQSTLIAGGGAVSSGDNFAASRAA
jgi:hypothetical protein